MKYLAALVLPILLMGAWQLCSQSGLLSPAYFPPPSATAEALWDSAISGRLWGPFGSTALRMFEGWLAATAAGVLLGAVIGSSKPARDYLQPFVEFLRPFPASAIIPAAILVFGLSNTMAVFVIAFGSLWPVLLGTLHGFASTEPRLREVARSLEMGRIAYLWKVAIPSALPDVFTGARIGLAIALILAVVVEMQAAQLGLGQNILLAQRMYRAPELYAGIIVLGLFGFLISAALSAFERHLLAWKTTH